MPADVMAHGAHVLTVCNACRYCEQYCPVFPAMERRLTFQPRRSRLPGQPLSQLRRVSLRLPVRAAARVRHQRAADAGGDPAAFVPGVRLAARTRSGVHEAQPRDGGGLVDGLHRRAVPRDADHGAGHRCGARTRPATSMPSSRTTSWCALFGIAFALRHPGSGRERRPLRARRSGRRPQCGTVQASRGAWPPSARPCETR